MFAVFGALLDTVFWLITDLRFPLIFIPIPTPASVWAGPVGCIGGSVVCMGCLRGTLWAGLSLGWPFGEAPAFGCLGAPGDSASAFGVLADLFTFPFRAWGAFAFFSSPHPPLSLLSNFSWAYRYAEDN